MKQRKGPSKEGPGCAMVGSGKVQVCRGDVERRRVVVGLHINNVHISMCATEAPECLLERLPRQVPVEEEATHDSDLAEVLALVTEEVDATEIAVAGGLQGEEKRRFGLAVHPGDIRAFRQCAIHQGGDFGSDLDQGVEVELFHGLSFEGTSSPTW